MLLWGEVGSPDFAVHEGSIDVVKGDIVITMTDVFYNPESLNSLNLKPKERWGSDPMNKLAKFFDGSRRYKGSNFNKGAEKNIAIMVIE